jgi:hypothetical protein
MNSAIVCTLGMTNPPDLIAGGELFGSLITLRRSALQQQGVVIEQQFVPFGGPRQSRNELPG